MVYANNLEKSSAPCTPESWYPHTACKCAHTHFLSMQRNALDHMNSDFHLLFWEHLEGDENNQGFWHSDIWKREKIKLCNTMTLGKNTCKRMRERSWMGWCILSLMCNKTKYAGLWIHKQLDILTSGEQEYQRSSSSFKEWRKEEYEPCMKDYEDTQVWMVCVCVFFYVYVYICCICAHSCRYTYKPIYCKALYYAYTNKIFK